MQAIRRRTNSRGRVFKPTSRRGQDLVDPTFKFRDSSLWGIIHPLGSCIHFRVVVSVRGVNALVVPKYDDFASAFPESEVFRCSGCSQPILRRTVHQRCRDGWPLILAAALVHESNHYRFTWVCIQKCINLGHHEMVLSEKKVREPTVRVVPLQVQINDAMIKKTSCDHTSSQLASGSRSIECLAPVAQQYPSLGFV